MTITSALELFDIVSINGLTADQLKRMYRELAKEYHPDKENGDDKKFVELKTAYMMLAKELLKNPTAGVETRDLKTLTKEEIVEKYEKDTINLKNQITLFRSSFAEQEGILNSLKLKVEVILSEFEERKQKLQQELEQEVGTIEKKYSGNLLSKILFFWPKMSEDEFWSNYHTKVEEFTHKHTKLDVTFFQEMLNVYGKSLNDLSNFTQKTQENLDKNEI